MARFWRRTPLVSLPAHMLAQIIGPDVFAMLTPAWRGYRHPHLDKRGRKIVNAGLRRRLYGLPVRVARERRDRQYNARRAAKRRG